MGDDHRDISNGSSFDGHQKNFPGFDTKLLRYGGLLKGVVENRVQDV